jgi:two-component system response regulator AtoC
VSNRLEIVLDRFVPAGNGRAIDLSNGDLVCLRTTAPRDDRDHRRRAEAAARMSALRIPGMAPLVDYGINGRNEWIEAHRLGPLGGTAGLAGERPLPARAIAALLARAGCAVKEGPRSRGEDLDSAGLFIPEPIEHVVAEEAEVAAQPPAASADTPAAATIIERRDELEPLMERIAGPAESGARIVLIEAPAWAGLRTFFDAIAREARLAGFVPVSSLFCSHTSMPIAGVDGGALCSALRDRHLLILDTPGVRGPSTDRAAVARFLSRLDTVGGRPHAVVCRCLAPGSEAAIALGPMRPAQLRRSLLCTGIDAARVGRAVDKAVRQSGGWPGAFAVLARKWLGLNSAEAPYRFSRAREAAVRESAPQRCEALETAPGGGQPSAMLVRAGELAGRGRHAAAERLLRRIIGHLHRRQRAGDQARALLALGRLLVARGRRTGAREAFEESRRLFDSVRDAAGVVLALVHLGAAHIEDGALPAAESVLRTAEVGATHAMLGERRRAAALLLARCLFWQGRHDDAWQLVEREAKGPADRAHEAAGVAERCAPSSGPSGWGASAAACPDPPALSAVVAEIGVRTALARRDPGLAARRLSEAGEAREQQGPMHAGTLIALRLLVQGALGDTNALARTAASGVALMRRLHAPLAAQEVRLALLEALIEAGARVQAIACLRRLESRRAPAVSGLARLRLDTLAARLRNPISDGAHRLGEGENTVDTAAVVRILQHCYEAQSEPDAIGGVCQTVRTALGAGAVSAFALVEGTMQFVAGAGQRACRPELAERSATSLLVVGPEECVLGRELAAPVRYGGAAVGSLAVRWPPGAPGAGESRARGILVAAAAAIGPAMAVMGSAAPVKHGADSGQGDLGGPSAAMAEVRRQVRRAAAAPYPVLILGESGTGKELIAKAIHAGSARRARRFCAVNCAALSDDLFETELFGHARGSFTGAAADRPGLFEEADGGTLFLDEAGELSPRAQAKLLRAIQEGEIRRVGENHPRRVDTRIVAATNRPLGDEVKAGRFRHDLLYRLDVVRITVPPLRERPEDVGPLAREFWREAMRRTGGRAELSSGTLAALARYDWPGNVRELQNTLAALAVHAPPRGRVAPSRLPAAILGAGLQTHGELLTLAEARRRFEERFVRATLARAGGHRTDAASSLGLSRQGLAKLLTRLGIGGEGGTSP